jgi:hypothetical protein
MLKLQITVVFTPLWFLHLSTPGHLSLKRLRGGGLGRNCFVGDPGRYVRKVSG